VQVGVASGWGGAGKWLVAKRGDGCDGGAAEKGWLHWLETTGSSSACSIGQQKHGRAVARVLVVAASGSLWW